MEQNSKYRVVGPRGEGPFEVEAASSLEAAAEARTGYGLDQPQGRHGAVIGYEPCGNGCAASAKVGAFDITWLGWIDR